MKNAIINAVKGFIIGISNIIPGVSGGTLAITLGIYEKIIDAISHFFKNFKENLKFLIPLGIGMVISLITMSGFISECYERNALVTTFFFVGLILGGIPPIFSKVKDITDHKKKNWIAFIFTFALVIFISLLDIIFGLNTVDFSNLTITGYIILLLVGVLTSSTMVIPGISGSLVLMVIGYYKPILDVVKNVTSFELNNLIILGVFAVGVLIGLVLIAKLVERLIKKQPIITYHGILGFVTSSVVALLIVLFKENEIVLNSIDVSASLVMVIFGFLVSYKIAERE